jgi:hypothetical protein
MGVLNEKRCKKIKIRRDQKGLSGKQSGAEPWFFKREPWFFKREPWFFKREPWFFKREPWFPLRRGHRGT